jgi:hypothetical protein
LASALSSRISVRFAFGSYENAKLFFGSLPPLPSSFCVRCLPSGKYVQDCVRTLLFSPVSLRVVWSPSAL